VTSPALVSLVGAGPGDPGLLTRRAFSRLRWAEAVYFDGLVPQSIVRIARNADLISVARRAGPKAITDAQVVARLAASALAGRRTVRLKAGDPFVMGRGHDEVLALASAGVSCEVVPGVTSATAAPLLAGIPLTRRGIASGFIVVSGHAPETLKPWLSTLAPDSLTVVVLMGMRQRDVVCQSLLDAGWSPETPVAVIADASRRSQRLWSGRLHQLQIVSPDSEQPGVIVIGRVVEHPLALVAPDALEREWRSHVNPDINQ
jgi:uroporphyrin-III C-methyltransferase / precorrin-2 dehydrogenase / sirohydrochlorin ferrochelatase